MTISEEITIERWHRANEVPKPLPENTDMSQDSTNPEPKSERESEGAVDQPRLVRRFRVRGVCLVPCDLELEIEAESEEEAVREALTCPWQQAVDANSIDARAAFDWQPEAVEINPANYWY